MADVAKRDDMRGVLRAGANEIERLRSKNDRLKAALTAILVIPPENPLMFAQDIARAVLCDTEDE
jgi:hypothetical protein